MYIYILNQQHILVQPPQAHTTTEEYDSNGRGWYFQFDNKMTYKNILSIAYTWMVQFNTYKPTICEENIRKVTERTNHIIDTL